MKTSDDQLNAVFKALADPTRRQILMQLRQGDATVNELAAPLPISQPAVSRHLKVLEQAGLVDRGIDEQRRPATLNARNMNAAVAYMEQFKAFWEGSFDGLGEVLQTLKTGTKQGTKPQNELKQNQKKPIEKQTSAKKNNAKRPNKKQ